MNTVLKRNIKKHLKSLPTAERLAKHARLGIAKKGWYARALKQIKEKYPEDYKLFIGILAGTSPRQTVEKNLLMTVKIYRTWIDKGRPLDDISLQELAKLSDLPAREGNVIRAFKGLPLSGNKVESFRRNLLGDLDAVTIDTWMLTYSGLKDNLNKAMYIAYSHRVKKASQKLKWYPAEVQETVWSWVYSQVNKCKIEEVAEFNL